MTGARTASALGTTLVTGAVSGIGRAIARQLAAEGHAVRLVDIVPADNLAGGWAAGRSVSTSPPRGDFRPRAPPADEHDRRSRSSNERDAAGTFLWT